MTFKILWNAVSKVGCTSTFDLTTYYLVDYNLVNDPAFYMFIGLTVQEVDRCCYMLITLFCKAIQLWDVKFYITFNTGLLNLKNK